jgi:hypothetical protein
MSRTLVLLAQKLANLIGPGNHRVKQSQRFDRAPGSEWLTLRAFSFLKHKVGRFSLNPVLKPKLKTRYATPGASTPIHASP